MAIASEIQYATYSDWKPQDYLTDYYTEILPDEQFTLEFLVDSLRKLQPLPIALDIGCGPIVSHIFPVVPKVQEIHMAEYVPSNRVEIEKWLAAREDAHDWRAFALETLRLEGTAPTAAQVDAREQQARTCVTAVLPCDVTNKNPLGSDKREFYSLVTAHYCAESISSNKENWQTYMQNIMSLVKPGGVLILSTCGAGNFYRVGDFCFPITKVNGQDLFVCFDASNFVNIDLRIRQVPNEQGFSNVIFVCAVKGA